MTGPSARTIRRNVTPGTISRDVDESFGAAWARPTRDAQRASDSAIAVTLGDVQLTDTELMALEGTVRDADGQMVSQV